MVGFDNYITFNKDGKILDYQKSYNSLSTKKLSVFLPLNYNNRSPYKAKLYISINNTFPKRVEFVEGIKCEDDLNKYEFDLTQFYVLNTFRKVGLSQFVLYEDNNEVKFQSEVFRI